MKGEGEGEGRNLGETVAITHDVFIRGDEHIELQAGDLLVELAGTLLLVAYVVHATYRREPLRELALPIDHHSIGHNDEVRPVVVLVLHQIRNQCHHLAPIPSRATFIYY